MWVTRNTNSFLPFRCHLLPLLQPNFENPFPAFRRVSAMSSKVEAESDHRPKKEEEEEETAQQQEEEEEEEEDRKQTFPFEEAETKHAEAKSLLNASDAESLLKACDILARVLALKTGKYGERDLRCAPVFADYGFALLAHYRAVMKRVVPPK